MSTDIKAAEAHPKVHTLFKKRWSPRAFSDKPVAQDDLMSIIDAARWAASSTNEQPWRFIIATKDDAAAHAKLLSLLVPANQAWAQKAPVLILIATKKTFSHNQQPNRHSMHDAGAALAHIFLQATELGLHAHGMAGFDVQRAQSELGIPADFEPAAFVALGYLGSPDGLTEAQQKTEAGPRQRKPISEIAFTTNWQEPYKFQR